jgi:hypothetical protein
MSIIVLLISLFFSLASPIFAQSEFNITQKINYQITPSGQALTTHYIELTNNYSEIYAKDYLVKLQHPHLSQIVGHDQTGDIIQKIDRNKEETIIYLHFAQPTIGKGQTHQFQLSYQLDQVLTTKGQTTEISLPAFKSSQINTSLTLIVPANLGNLAYSSLPLQNQTTSVNQNHYTFKPQTVSTPSLLFAFGDSQIYDFSLSYYLKNSDSTEKFIDITIPPDSLNQQVIYHDFNPHPQNITIDPDGNWLARYPVSPQSHQEVEIKGQIKIIPQLEGSPAHPSPSYLETLTQETDLWPSRDSTIKEIASRLSSPQDIYNYVVNTLSYNYQLLDGNHQRLGALQALLDPNNSLCTEFTDLFVTLARAKGIPAREIEGFAYTNNSKIKPVNSKSDILHAWPQYWDKNRQNWIAIDPTWGKTTNGLDYFHDLDLNHIALVIHGTNPTLPLPPGSYRHPHQPKSLQFTFANQFVAPDFAPAQVKISTKIGQPATITLTNPNSAALTNISINLSRLDWQHQIDLLPPFSYRELTLPPAKFTQSLLPQSQKYNFQITSDQITSQTNLTNPYHYYYLSLIIGLLILLLSLGGIIVTSIKSPHD